MSNPLALIIEDDYDLATIFDEALKAADFKTEVIRTGNTAMTALQKMIMQTDGKRIIMLPAWPEDWDMRFKLHAPFQTVVEGEYRDGSLEIIRVTPEGRAKDIEFAEDLPEN